MEIAADKRHHAFTGQGITTLQLKENKLPLVIEPEGSEFSGIDHLLGWIRNNHDLLRNKMTEHGAVLFRNFKVDTALDFEKIAITIDPDLKNDYLGTSPRNKRTDYVFSASELPGFYPIPQHCEMSYLKNPPRNLFFYCSIEPEHGGETPIVDFRKVYAQMDPKIREEFIRKGIKNIRNYDGPDVKRKWDLWKLKRWDEMFLTTDKKKVEEICQEWQLEYHWKENDKLVLIDKYDATLKHPVTGEPVWFNHLQVFHAYAGKVEYEKIAERQKTLRSYFFNLFISFMTFLKSKTVKTEDLALHCTFQDGSEIPVAYLRHVEDLIWKNMVIFPWKKGDVIAIDNFSTSHGRLPYSGPREILVSWSA